MHFKPIIDEWGAQDLAADLGLPMKNIRSWLASDSIPADWFLAIERAARRKGKPNVTAKRLAEIAEQRRLAREGQAVQ